MTHAPSIVDPPRMRRRIACFVLAMLALVAGALWIGDLAGDQKYTVAVVSPAPLYALPPTDYPNSNPVVKTLSAGVPLRVLRVRYGKDFEALKVETPNGEVGWVSGGEGVTVASRG
ncbi:MAG TPA: SH3 domain-containing protein [Methyloversatilis sp.]